MWQSGKFLTSHRSRCFIFMMVGWFSVASLCGCANGPSGYGVNPESSGTGTYRTTGNQPQAVDPDTLAMQQYARRVNAALDHQQSPPPAQTSPTQQEVPQVRWLEPVPHSAETPGNPPVAVDRKAAMPPTAVETKPTRSNINTVAQPMTTKPQTLTRAQMLDRLEQEIRSGEQSAFDKAIALVAVGSVEQSSRLTEADLSRLTASERRLVEGYRKSLKALQQSIDHEDVMVNVTELTEQISGAFGRQPISIRRIELVRRIDGYGVYEVFAKHPHPDDKDQMVTTMLAGRPHKVGIYVEIDNFYSLQQPNGQWQVMLEHELELYNESDGLRVWHQPRMQVVDHCRNKRRDFFYRQLVTLPANLGVGKYLLKVRVTDLNGQSIYEQVVPLHFVADKALTRTSASPYLDQGPILPQR